MLGKSFSYSCQLFYIPYPEMDRKIKKMSKCGRFQKKTLLKNCGTVTRSSSRAVFGGTFSVGHGTKEIHKILGYINNYGDF